MPGRARDAVSLSGRLAVKTAVTVGVTVGVAATVAAPAATDTSADHGGLAASATSAALSLQARGTESIAMTQVAAPASRAPVRSGFGLTGLNAKAKPATQLQARDVSAYGTASRDSDRAGLGNSRAIGGSLTPRVHASGESGLTGNARVVLARITWAFPEITSVGGVRADSLPDHPSGHALDFMIPSPFSSGGVALGNSIVATIQAHATEWNVKYLIYRQRIWFPNSGWRTMSDRGGATANHMDHVHVTVN